MKRESIARILEIVFNNLTMNAETFIDWYNFKTTEIKIADVKIGIGILNNFSVIKLFYIDENCRHGNKDYRRFQQTFRIGGSNSIGPNGIWNLDLAVENLKASVGNFSFLSNHFLAANEIMQIIKKEEAIALEKEK